MDRPSGTLDRWDAWTRAGRYLVTIAGADAHARLGWRDFEDDDAGEPPALKLPAYESVFRTFSTSVILDGPAGRRCRLETPGASSRRWNDGRSFTSIDGVAGPPRFEFFARTRDSLRRRWGSRCADGAAVTFVARAMAPAGTQLRLLRNGAPVAESSGLELSYETTVVARTG